MHVYRRRPAAFAVLNSSRNVPDVSLPLRVAGLLVSLLWLAGCVTGSRPKNSGPWDVAALSKTPAVAWGATTGLVQELYYEGEPLNGKPTRVFAYLGRPVKDKSLGSTEFRPTAKRPAMVLVHGGGGKAFKDWAEHWARRGYVALAMDLSGNGPAGRLPDGGPDQSDQTKFRNFSEAEAREMWTYHAVAAVLRGHSLVRSLPEVDAERVGVTGISWGGYLTCIVAGIDPRFKVAVPVYGCGFLGENSVWKDGALAMMTPEARELWLKLFDPSQYLANVRRPILFANGTTDFAYPLDSYQKSYRLVPDKWRHVSVAVGRPHGHIWTFPEVDAFVDSVLRGEPPLVRIGPPMVNGGRITAGLDRIAALKEVSLCYTTNSGPWQQRVWQTMPARISDRQIVAELPSIRPLVAFVIVKDEHGHVSSEHVDLRP
jgi:dienelactone hydrolase